MTGSFRLRGLGVAWLAAVAIGVGSASAMGETFTPVGNPWPNEDSHREILNRVYGGEFELVDDGVSYTNNVVTAQRISDDQDQVWQLNLPVHIRAQARFAAFDQSLGYLPGESGPTDEYVNLVDVDGRGYNVSGEALNVDLTNEPFRWARRGRDGVVSSLEADNPEGADHMVTYQIQGLDRLQPVYLLFFEDTFGDFDFQDLVVEVAAIPSPAALGPGLALLGVLGLIRRRKA